MFQSYQNFYFEILNYEALKYIKCRHPITDPTSGLATEEPFHEGQIHRGLCCYYQNGLITFSLNFYFLLRKLKCRIFSWLEVLFQSCLPEKLNSFDRSWSED